MFTERRRKLPKFIGQEEISAILDKARKDRYRNYILLLMMTRTGMRVSEVTKIKKRDISDDGIMIRQGKGGKDRLIPLEKELSNILGLFCDSLKPKSKLFPISTRQVRNIVYKYAPAGLEVHPHTLRHSFAVHCLKSGMNIRSLQKILGHNNLTTTQVYLDITGADVKEDFGKVKW